MFAVSCAPYCRPGSVLQGCHAQQTLELKKEYGVYTSPLPRLLLPGPFRPVFLSHLCSTSPTIFLPRRYKLMLGHICLWSVMFPHNVPWDRVAHEEEMGGPTQCVPALSDRTNRLRWGQRRTTCFLLPPSLCVRVSFFPREPFTFDLIRFERMGGWLLPDINSRRGTFAVNFVCSQHTV